MGRKNTPYACSDSHLSEGSGIHKERNQEMKMYPHTFSGEPAVQVESELKGFIKLLKDEGVKSYLEVGVGRGDTFHEIVSALPDGSTAVSVDLPESAWGLNNSQEQLKNVLQDLHQTRNVAGLFGNSRDQELVQRVRKLGPYDCVFIDGDHTLEGVKADFKNYGPMGRIVAFHDIVDTMVPNLRKEKIEVPVFWNEIKQKYRHVEFIAPGSTMGIGVIYVNP